MDDNENRVIVYFKNGRLAVFIAEDFLEVRRQAMRERIASETENVAEFRRDDSGFSIKLKRVGGSALADAVSTTRRVCLWALDAPLDELVPSAHQKEIDAGQMSMF